MQLKATARTLIAFLAAGALASAQADPHKPAPQEKPAAKPAGALEAGAKTDAPMLLQFGVMGLTKDNESKVKESLTALTASRYVCEACKVDKAMAGKCPKCSGELAMKKKPVLQSSQAMTDKESLSVTVAPGATLSYSELESALGKNSVHIDAAKFAISGKAELILRGGTAENATAIQKSLDDAKLFEHVKASFDPAKSEIVVMVQAGATPPTRAKVASTIEAAGTKLQLSDVLFGGAPKG